MKSLFALILALFVAAPMMAKDKEKDEKEPQRQMYTAVVEGGTDADADPSKQIMSALAELKGVKVESVKKGEKGCDVVLSTDTKKRISKMDLTKALKELKEFKVTEFKAQRPEREKRGKDKEEDDKKKDDK